MVVMPGAGYLEMVLAASAVTHGKPWNVCGAMLIEPLLLEKIPKSVQTVISPDGPGTASFRIVSLKQDEPDADPTFTTLATGRLEAPCAAAAEPIDVNAVLSEFTAEPRDEQWQIEALRKSGLEPGPTFLWSPRHWFSETTGLGEVRAATEGDRVDDYQYHPGMMDGGFQLLGALLPGAGEGIDAYVPMGVERIHFYERPREVAWSIATLKSLTANMATGEVQIMDQSGRVLVKMEGVRLRKVPRDWLARKIAGPLPDWCYELMWTPKPLEGAAAEQMIDADSWLIFDSPGAIGSAWHPDWRSRANGRPSSPPAWIANSGGLPWPSFCRAIYPGGAASSSYRIQIETTSMPLRTLKPPAKAAGAASSTYWQAWPTPTRPVERTDMWRRSRRPSPTESRQTATAAILSLALDASTIPQPTGPRRTARQVICATNRSIYTTTT